MARQPTDDPMWQESMALHFLMPGGPAGVVAFGAFANRGQGLTWVGLHNGAGATFQRSANGLTLADDDRGDARIGVGGVRWERRPGGGRLTVHDERVELDLVFDDLYAETPWVVGAGLDDLAHGHVETSCHAVGTLTLGEVTVDIDALAHRDHSWGPRRLEVCLNHRWVAGTCGPALSFALDNLVVADGTLLSMGYVARDGAVDAVREVNNLVTLGPDCLTPYAYESRVTLASGEQLVISSETIAARFVNLRCWSDATPGFVAVDAIASVRCGELTGIADLNLTVNPQAGRAAAVLFTGGRLEDGLTDA